MSRSISAASPSTAGCATAWKSRTVCRCRPTSTRTRRSPGSTRSRPPTARQRRPLGLPDHGRLRLRPACPAAWLGWTWRRHKRLPGTPWFLRASALSGLAAVLALEAGWVVTEVGRQPWIVHRVMRTAEAVNPAPRLVYGFVLVSLVYLVLTIATAHVLRRLARDQPMPIAPRERDVTDYKVV
ncbi:cytochrome ubiquinol oxidase subunit I [Streptomyces sp. GD-15H]|uniref:cytochrome ubiquinol oxidase subunit I n=1 Tax=Streptomyces sp. GD-15H TaxID=3129112 RepID=UPI0032523981